MCRADDSHKYQNLFSVKINNNIISSAAISLSTLRVSRRKRYLVLDCAIARNGLEFWSLHKTIFCMVAVNIMHSGSAHCIFAGQPVLNFT